MPYSAETQALLATNTNQLLTLQPGTSCTVSCAQRAVLQVLLPFALRLQDSTGVKIFLHLLLITYQCHATSFQSKNFVFLLYFHSGMILSLSSFPYIILPQGPTQSQDWCFQANTVLCIYQCTKFLSTCDDCQALFKRKFYLYQFTCSSPVHCFFFPCCQDTVNEQLLIHINCL
jgi:hypothetical protein